MVLTWKEDEESSQLLKATCPVADIKEIDPLSCAFVIMWLRIFGWRFLEG